jgi:hypothetical protein
MNISQYWLVHVVMIIFYFFDINLKNKYISAASIITISDDDDKLIRVNNSSENKNGFKNNRTFGMLNNNDSLTKYEQDKNKIQEIGSFINKEKACAHSLKLEDNKDWQCKLKYQKWKTQSNNKNYNQSWFKKPLFYVCSYEYDCNLENEKFFFSFDYLVKLKNQNKLKNIDRGPDHQCEKLLKKQTHRVWSCSLKEEFKSNLLDNNDEYYCDCFYQNKCKHQRFVDLF